MQGHRGLWLLAALAVAGCGGDDDASASDAGASDGGMPDAAGRDGGGESDAGIPSSVRIVASEGGEVASPDGVFTLFVPPGAIAEDTDFSISIVPRSEWPAAFDDITVVGEVYDVQPDGLVFSSPARAELRWASPPAALADTTGVPLAVTTLDDMGGLESSRDNFVAYQRDGSIQLAASIEHLSPKTAYIPLTDVDAPFGNTLTIDAEGGTRQVGVPFGPSVYRIDAIVLSGGRQRDPRSQPIAGARLGRVETSFGDATLSYEPEVSPGELVPMGATLAETPLTTGEMDLPFFSWTCTSAGPDIVWAGVRLTFEEHPPYPDAPTYTVRSDVVVDVDDVACEDDVPAGHPPGAEILLADFCEASRVGSTFECSSAAAGTIANVIVPTAETRSHLTPVGSTSAIFEGVESWASETGAPVITMTTSRQSVTATHDGTSYAVSGLTTGPVLAFPDDLVVTGTPPGGSEVSVTVPAIDPATTYLTGMVLETADGLRSRMRAQDGGFDAMYVYATATGSSMAGEAGVMRVVPAAAMTADGTGERSAPLLDDATIAALEGRGLTLDTILVGPVRFVESDALFPGETVPVMAGRLLRVPAAQFVATPPAGECVPPSADLARSSTTRVSLCYAPTEMVCGMQLREDCVLAEWIGSFRDRGTDFTFYTENDPPLTLRSTTHGTIESSGILYNRVVGLPLDTDVTIQLAAPVAAGSDDVRFTFRRTGTVVEILDFQRVPPP